MLCRQYLYNAMWAIAVQCYVGNTCTMLCRQPAQCYVGNTCTILCRQYLYNAMWAIAVQCYVRNLHNVM